MGIRWPKSYVVEKSFELTSKTTYRRQLAVKSKGAATAKLWEPKQVRT